MATNVLRYDDDTAFPQSVGATITAGTPVGIDSGGLVQKADADAPLACVGFLLTDGASGEVRAVATEGVLQDSAWNWNIGSAVYLSATPGTYTQTAPTGAGTYIQILGIASAADKIVFRPNLAALKLQAAGTTTVAFI